MNRLVVPSIGVALIVGVALFAWGFVADDGSDAAGQPGWEVSVAEAQSVLDRAVSLVQAHRFDELWTEMNAGIVDLPPNDQGALIRAPYDAPEVVGTKVLPPGEHTAGGRILIVRGVDAFGQQYETEFYVIRGAGFAGFAAPYPLYWSGVRIIPSSS